MDTILTAIKAALAGIGHVELQALIAATYTFPPTAPELLAWIDGTGDWELNRRRDFDYPLLPSEAAIDPSENAVSIDAAMLLRATFAQDSPAVVGLFDALVIVDSSRWMSTSSRLIVGLPEDRRAGSGRESPFAEGQLAANSGHTVKSLIAVSRWRN
jgi:hypothetical protein